ncbi:MAG: tetratricopeptide repeat protein, partial [Myxococcota bacterium]
AAAQHGAEVVLATKLRLGDSNTVMAEGGIQAAIEKPDTPQKHFNDTVQAGRGERAVEVAQQLEQPKLRSLIRGRVLLAQGRPDAALAALDEGVRLWPNNPAGRFLTGQAAERSGRFDRAISEYREALRANAAVTEAGLALAGLHQLRDDRAAALDAIWRFVRSRPREPAGYIASVRIARAIDAEAVRVESLRRLAALPGQAAAALALRAEASLEDEGPDAALALIEASDLALTDPTNLAALRVWLDAQARQGGHETALATLREAAASHPDAAIFRELEAGVLRAAGDPSLARQQLERALELAPDLVTTLRALADLEAAEGNTDAALALCDRAIRADPEDPAAALAAIRLLEDDPARGDEVVQRLVWLLARHPREAAATYDLARHLAQRGDPLRALAYAERSLWLLEPRALADRDWIEELRASADATAVAPAGS